MIRHWYATVLERPSVPPEERYWSDQLVKIGVPTVASHLLRSPEHRKLRDTRIHRDLLGRAPTAAEHETCISRIEGGHSWRQWIVMILTSKEFVASHGGTPAAATAAWFEAALGRRPDDATQAALVQSLANGTQPVSLVLALLRTREARTLMMKRTLEEYLGVTGSVAPRWDGVTAQLATGHSEDEARAAVLASRDFFDRLCPP